MLLIPTERLKATYRSSAVTWRRFVELFVGTFAVGHLLIFTFVLLVDPYEDVPFSLPLQRRLIDANQRFMYPQIVRSGLFDSLVVGTSSSRLLDPLILNEEFAARFANLSMDAATAWEQKTIANLFHRSCWQAKGNNRRWNPSTGSIVDLPALPAIHRLEKDFFLDGCAGQARA